MDNQAFPTKLCAICGETIKESARKCIYCNEFIDDQSSNGRWPRWTGFNGKTLWEWITVLIFPVLLGTAGIWVARDQYEFEVAQEISQQETAVAGVTATSAANLATLEAGIAFQATQDAQHTATRSVVTAEAQSTAKAVVAVANVRMAEASGNQASIQVALDEATVQAEQADAALYATADAINAEAADAEATQAAVSLVTAEARVTADAVNLEATIAVVELSTFAATPSLTPTSTLTVTSTATATMTATIIPTSTFSETPAQTHTLTPTITQE